MKYYFRFLIVPLLLGAVSFLLYAARLPEVPATTVLLNTAFQNTHLMPDDIPEILTRFLPLLLFQIFYGTMIYRHFCTASIYYFSRKTKRVRWFLPECGILFLYALAYSAVLLFSGIGIVAAFGKLRWDPGFLPLMVYYLLIYSLFLFFTTLAINILSILVTGSAAFIIVEAVNLICIAVYSVLDPVSKKAAGYVAVMNRLDMEMKKAEEIEKRYKAIKESRKNAIQRMKDACLWACDELGVDHIDAGDMTIKVKNNGGQLPLIIDKPELVPENLTKITIEPDNAKIREYLKDNECDFAHIGERGRHIEVK